MTQLEKYPAYKDSGVEWLGEIPAGWEVLANKHLFTLKKNQVGRNSSNYLLLSLTLNGVIVRDMINPQGKFPAEFDTYQEVKQGDFVFCLFDVEETPRTVGLSEFDGMITGAYTVMQSNGCSDKKFLYYFYLNLDADKRMKPLYTGLRNTISKDNFFCFKTFLPSLPEQTAIANFLDEKTAKIDTAITQKQQMISLLKEHKQILIQNAVTKGINPDAKMKDSGVEWIGEVPEGWEVRRSKYVFTQRTERARKDDVQLSATQAYGVIPQDEYESKIGRRVVKIQFHLDKRKHVELNDFVISMRSFQGGLVVLRPLEKICADFYGYLLKLTRYICALQSTGNFIRDGQDLNFENFAMVDLFVPPIPEQAAIVDFIETQSAKIDTSISIQQQQIAKLKEYKSTLIDSAVTGKIKVC